MRHALSLADLVTSHRDEVIALCLADASDIPLSADTARRALEAIVANLRAGETRRPVAPLHAPPSGVPARLRRAVLRMAASEGTCIDARDLLVLNDSIDTFARAPVDEHATAEQAARVDAEAARARAREAEAHRDAAVQRLRFLAEASRLLAESMDYQRTLRTVASLAVPHIADWCVVDLLQDDGRMARVAIEHRDRDRLALAHRLQEHFPPRTGAPAGPAHVVHTGVTEFEPQVSTSLLEEIAPEAERRRILEVLGMHSYLSVALNARGRVLGTISFFTDAGRSLTREDALIAEDLARRAATAIDNARLYDQARRAVGVRDDMLAIVTHDLRTPLSAIITAAATQIASARDDEDGQRLRQRGEAIRRSAEHMGRLVRDLADIGQIDTGRFAISRRPQDVSALVRDVVETLTPDALQRGTRLAADIVDTPSPVEADADRIVQVLCNLVSNAAKAGASSVTVRVAERDHDVLVTVADTGPGIRGEDLPHMFDRYWRGRTAQYKGTGLGLPISKEIVTAHGGEIWINSAPGVGSTVFFTLPK